MATSSFRPAPQLRDATLVIVEYGAVWPRWLDPARHGGGDMAMVAQHYEGAARSLVEQAARRITRLETAGWHFVTVVLSVSSRTDPEAVSARAELVRGLWAKLGAASRGRLVLTVDESQGARVLRGVDVLCSTLDEAPGVEVEICIGCATAEARSAERLAASA